jgi:uncharacterized protein YbjT (DUF2867 family)
MAHKNAKVILVTGATGRQGGAAVRRLRERGFSVRALTRDPDQPKARVLTGPGTEVVRGDLDDQASLTRALEGVHGVFSVQGDDAGGENEARQGINLADAAKRARISHLVHSSVAAADQDTGVPDFAIKLRIEEHIRESGLRYTILRPVFFMENWVTMRSSIETGNLALPLEPATRLQMIAADDVGAFATLAFEHPGKWQGHTVDIAGDEFSMNELAAAFSRMTGREVQYQQLDWGDFEQRAGREATLLYRWLQNPAYRIDIAAVRQEHPGLIGFERWLHSKWQSVRAA